MEMTKKNKSRVQTTSTPLNEAGTDKKQTEKTVSINCERIDC